MITLSCKLNCTIRSFFVFINFFIHLNMACYKKLIILIKMASLFKVVQCVLETSFPFGMTSNRSYSSTANKRSVTWLKKWGRRDMKRRNAYAEDENERLRLRMLKKTAMIPSLVRMQASKDLSALPVNSSITRIRNRCVLTDRSRGVVTQYHISRHKFKQLADSGLIPGLHRSSW